MAGWFTFADGELTGSNREFLEVVRRCDRGVLRFALAITGDEAAALSIYTRVFLLLRDAGGPFTSERSLQVAAYGAAANLCLEYLGQARARDTSLTPYERIVLELRHYHGVRLELVGEILGTNEAVARSTMVRALHKMRTVTTPNAQCGPRAQPQTPASAFVNLDGGAE